MIKPEIDNAVACIMDMDGVVTDTARLHARAWKRMFDDFLKENSEKNDEEFREFAIDTDYPKYVDGKPRYDGVSDFLAARNISLPYGSPEDPPERQTICGLGNRKNSFFHELLKQEGVAPYDSTVSFIRKGRKAGLRFALISASRNAAKVLKAAGLRNLFEVVVDGTVADSLELAGKPAPDIFLEAAARLAAKPAQTIVIEDARAGVAAGKAGGFSLVIGVDRHGQARELTASGADLVVSDLAELVIEYEERQRKAQELPSALEQRQKIFDRLLAATPAIFLDYDGTLTPIVENPAEARLAERTRQVLEELAGHLFVAVISGRGLADIRAMVGIDDIVYAGSHGFEISGGGGYFDESGRREHYLRALEQAEGELAAAAEELPGVRLERKPFAIALHYRQAEQRTVRRLEDRLDAIIGQIDGVKKTSGKKIFEVRPAVDWDKGRALQALLDRDHVDCSATAPLYIGDDTTDEDAFRAIAENGIPILVSDRGRPTSARYLLKDPSEVVSFLEMLRDRLVQETGKGIWTLRYEGFDPEKETLREALCSLGNGNFASRGAAPESEAGSNHYPGTYFAGCYNRLESRIEGTVIENESLVNAPNWLCLTFRLENGSWFGTRPGDLQNYSQELDIASGILTRRLSLTDEQGRKIRLVERRLVSMAVPYLAGLESEITVENWSGAIQVRSALDGRVANTLVERYQSLNNEHLQPCSQGGDRESGIIWLQVETSQSHIRLAEAGRTRFFQENRPLTVDWRVTEEPGYINQESTMTIEAGKPLRVEKIVALYDSRDRAMTESLHEARQEVACAADFSSLIADHRRAWSHLWQRCGIGLQVSSPRIAQVLNLHIFHLLQTVSVHAIDLDVGIPPRGLTGEAYRGLIMWDELFVFPFFNLRIPDLTRALLKYRYRRLPRARRAAREAGLAGAMFPWQSGSNGREEAQTLHLNPQSGRWITDNTQLQRHINIAVAYNTWLYYQVSGDIDFMSFYGAELIIEIARFWAGLARYNASIDRYEIKGVMGPDEFHSRYPGAEEPGIDNNAYTNVMAAWLFCRTLEVLELLPEERRQPLWENLGLEQRELTLWEDISRKMHVPFHGDGIISQFEGYDELEEFDWQRYRDKYGDIHRLDRILEAEGDSPDRYKLSKQADVLMLFYLLSSDELAQIFTRLGYSFEYETIPRNIDYYLKRTSHGSTLSRVVHAWVLARSRREQSWNLFCDALKSDVSDIQGGTTHEGIHLGAMAGTVDLIQRCYTGLETRENTLRFNPALPREIKEMSFALLYRHHWLRVTIQRKRLTIASLGEDRAPITIGWRQHVWVLRPGRTIDIDLQC